VWIVLLNQLVLVPCSSYPSKIKDSLISLKEASEISDYSVDYLNVMARRGTIPAFKLKRNWMVSKKAFEKYLKKKKR